MKHLRKITLLLAVIALLFNVSCSKDDDETTVDLSAVQFAFDQSNPPIDQTVINNLAMTDDTNAALISSYLSTANLMTIWLTYFNQPSTAVQADSPIGTCGGNSATYTWTSSAGGETFAIAYQICETDEDYIFQIFWSVNGGDFEQIIYAEESKGELRDGFMQLFASDPTSDIGNTAVIEYSWKENTDGSLDYTVSIDGQGVAMQIKVNPDNSGTIEYRLDGELFYEATWNSSGTSGTYTFYSDGQATDSGSWPS